MANEKLSTSTAGAASPLSGYERLAASQGSVATFTASCTGTTLSVSAVASGSLLVGALVSLNGMAPGTFIVAQLSGTPGGVGDYQVSVSQTLSSNARTSAWRDVFLTTSALKSYIGSNLANRPKLIPQQMFYSPHQSLGAASLTPVVGSYYGALFRGRPGDQFDSIAIEISTAPTTGGNVRVGLYAHDVETKLPKASAGLIYDSGSIAFTTGSFALSTTPALITLPAAQAFPADGDVWVVLQTDTVASMQWRRAGAVYGHNLLVRAVNAGALSSTNGDAGLAGTGTFGAMPSNPPTMTSSGQAIPAMALYKS